MLWCRVMNLSNLASRSKDRIAVKSEIIKHFLIINLSCVLPALHGPKNDFRLLTAVNAGALTVVTVSNLQCSTDTTETEISRKRCYEKCSSLQRLCLCVFTIYTKAASVWQPHSSLVLGEHFEAWLHTHITHKPWYCWGWAYIMCGQRWSGVP